MPNSSDEPPTTSTKETKLFVREGDEDAPPSPVDGPKGNAHRRGRAVLAKGEKSLQGAAMLARRVMLNQSQEEIARQFNVSIGSVQKRLSEAKQDSMVELAKEIIAEKMLPKALGILDAQLNEGNYEAAKDVLFGSHALSKASGKPAETARLSATPTLDAIRLEKNRIIDVTPQLALPAQETPAEAKQEAKEEEQEDEPQQ